MPWVSAGCWVKRHLAIMDKQTTQAALTEEVSKNNDPKGPKAKQIFLGRRPPGFALGPTLAGRLGALACLDHARIKHNVSRPAGRGGHGSQGGRWKAKGEH